MLFNDTLAYNGSSYICIKNTTIGILPTDTNYFNLLSQRGIDGSGSIVTINGKSPDLNGNVQIDANEIGAILVTEKNIPNGVATLNSDGKVVDIDGNEIEGKVKSVNNIQPDENGNITISIPTKTSQLTNDSSFETTEGSQTKMELAEQHAKEYTDQAIANANQGEVKMVYYPYVLKATTDNQTEFTIPLETFDAVNDFLQVVQNTTILNKEEHYTVIGKTITLNEGVANDTSLFITIIKNTLVGAEGAVNGNLIKDGSLPLNKLAEPVVTSFNGQTGDINLAIPTKTSELTNDSNFATTENVNAVSTNLENHESKIASTTELGHVKVDGETITIDETGVISSLGGNGYELSDGAFSKDYSTGNLNDLVDEGRYVSNGATIERHFPVPYTNVHRIFIDVSKGTDRWVKQIVTHSQTDENRMWVRGNTGGTWNQWSEVVTDQNINTSTAMTTIYVDGALGMDSPEKGGSRGAGAFKTIKYAINQLKRLNLGQVTISIANGTYNEVINIDNKFGADIRILGDGLVTVDAIFVSLIDKITIRDITVKGQLYVDSIDQFSLEGITRTTAFNDHGIFIRRSRGLIKSTLTSYCTGTNTAGLCIVDNSDVYLSSTVQGGSNTIGLYVSGAVVRKGQTFSLTGSTPTKTEYGGQIL